MRALPTLGLLTFLFLLVRSQAISTLVTLVVLAVPPVLADSYAGVRSVDAGVVDAARGMGMTSAQRLWQVELPGALALLLGGVRSAVLQVVATTTVAAYVGLDGLGRLLLDGLNSADYPQTAAGALVIAALALMLDLLLAGLARLMVPTGCRLSRQSGGGRLSRQSDKGPLAAAGEAGKSNTTSPDIAANHWVELADPKHMYPAQRIVPLIRAGSLDQAGIDALNRVSAVLTTATLTELNRRITQDRAAPADLAKDFVNGLR